MFAEPEEAVLPVVFVLAAPPVVVDALPVVLVEPLAPPEAVPDAVPDLVPDVPDVPD
jgi:hypothetical protein